MCLSIFKECEDIFFFAAIRTHRGIWSSEF
jgi:hypothetical protein